MKFLHNLLLLAVMAPAAALAAPPPPSVQRLTDAQVEQILAEAAAKREAAEAAEGAPKPAIHGEVGVEVGTGGHRAAFGTAVVPLGSESVATVSFLTATSRDGGRRRR
jgi:hypothetical protein